MPSPPLRCRDDILKMLDELHEGRQEILQACDQLSPAQLNDPVIPGTWSVLKIMQHIAWAEEYILAWIKKRPEILPQNEFPAEPPADLSAVKTALDEAHAAAIAFLKGNPESVLTESCRYGRNATNETVGGLFFHIVRHETGHRAFARFKLRQLQNV
jgi:uncharacterized damage-inducible protein DinB